MYTCEVRCSQGIRRVALGGSRFVRAAKLGGKARAAKLAPERRSEIARMGGLARWYEPEVKVQS
jgi:hypothetical protein